VCSTAAINNLLLREDRTDPEQIGQGLARDSPAAAHMVKEILGGLQEDLYYDASALPCFLSFITWLQDNPPLRSGIPECKMKGAADFAVNMVRVVGRKDRLRKENLRDFHHIILT
jgi:hypothetical protein